MSQAKDFVILKTKKKYFDCERNKKFLHKKSILNQSKELSDFSKSIGLRIKEIILTPGDDDQNQNQIKTKITVMNDYFSQQKEIFQYLKAKDSSLLSVKHYILLRKSLQGIHRIPSPEKITNLQHKLDKFFELKKDQRGNGYYCLPEQKIKFVCESFLLKNKNFASTNFRIKINIDSTSITSTNLIILNVSFNLIDDVELCMNINGTYLLGSFEIVKEDYEEVKQSLNEFLILLRKINFIKISEINYKIDFFLGCDYKAIRIIYGQRASNALNGCFWCNARMDEVPKVDDIDNNKYTLSRRLSDPIENKEPLIDFIELDMCVLDDLHLLIRIFEKLLDLLLLKFIQLDENSSDNLALRKHLLVFIEFLETKCKIRKSIYKSSSRPKYGKILFRTFSGTEIKRIFFELYEAKFDKKTKIKIQDALFMVNLLFPKPEKITDNFEKEDLLWLGFYKLLNLFQNFPFIKSIEERKLLTLPIKESLKSFLTDYLFVSKKYRYSEKLSPYLHCFIFHYCQMLELHGNIHLFNTQPNEKLNDFLTKYYHRSTNKINMNKKYLLQLIQKRNRLEFYNLNGELEDFYSSDEDEELINNI